MSPYVLSIHEHSCAVLEYLQCHFHPVKLNQVLSSSLFHFELGGPELDCAGLISHASNKK